MRAQISLEYLSTVLVGILLLSSAYAIYSFYLNERIKRTKTMSELEILKSEINNICYEDIGTERVVRVYIPYYDVETIESDYEIGIKKGKQTFTVITNCPINVSGEFKGELNVIKLKRERGYVGVMIG